MHGCDENENIQDEKKQAYNHKLRTLHLPVQIEAIGSNLGVRAHGILNPERRFRVKG